MQNISEYSSIITVVKSFYMTFEGRCCYCAIPELYVSKEAAQMVVVYKAGDEEKYSMTSKDGVHYQGAMCTDDDSRVDFTKFTNKNLLLLAGVWKCGGREGEWYIEGEVTTCRQLNFCQ